MELKDAKIQIADEIPFPYVLIINGEIFSARYYQMRTGKNPISGNFNFICYACEKTEKMIEIPVTYFLKNLKKIKPAIKKCFDDYQKIFPENYEKQSVYLMGMFDALSVIHDKYKNVDTIESLVYLSHLQNRILFEKMKGNENDDTWIEENES